MGEERSRTVRVGVISDTHGLLRPEAAAALSGCSRIVHAGDVGTEDVLEALRRIAPVAAVRGNVDVGPPLSRLPETLQLELAGHRVLVLHDRSQLRAEPRAAGLAAVISGHTHRSGVSRADGVLFVNPGSAGPRRFHLPVSVAILTLSPRGLHARVVVLDV